MLTQAVIGLGFGDEGKGKTVNYLAKENGQYCLVVRYNGGHQAGHTVVENDKKHIFSTFGSGTFQQAPTFVSRFCTFYPHAFFVERDILQKITTLPVFYLDPMAMITTPFDVSQNQQSTDDKRNGTCGVGFGQTIKRHEDYHYKLFARDILHESVFIAKLENIYKFYNDGSDIKNDVSEKIFQGFVEEIREIRELIANDEFVINSLSEVVYNIHNTEEIIFEGAQGILLDMEHGFFPNVTRSHTTSKNIFTLIDEESLYSMDNLHYVTRAYQTRHGNGFMTNENVPLDLVNTDNETNKSGGWQGDFRLAPLDINLMKYALTCDAPYSKETNKILSLNCIDQITKPDLDEVVIPVFMRKKLKHYNFNGLLDLIRNNVHPFELDEMLLGFNEEGLIGIGELV